MKNIFTAPVANEVISRINQLTPESKRLWGKMTVSQMLAHCSVTYEQVYDENYPKSTFFEKLLAYAFARSVVIGKKPYTKNSPTAKNFIIKGERNFEIEKKRLIDFINKTQQLGENHFDNKASISFGKLNQEQWNTMFYKHLDYHLTQFGV